MYVAGRGESLPSSALFAVRHKPDPALVSCFVGVALAVLDSDKVTTLQRFSEQARGCSIAPQGVESPYRREEPATQNFMGLRCWEFLVKSYVPLSQRP